MPKKSSKKSSSAGVVACEPESPSSPPSSPTARATESPKASPVAEEPPATVVAPQQRPPDQSSDEGFIEETMRSLMAMTLRDWTVRSVLVMFLAASAIVMWKSIIIFSWSEIPIVVVLSGSMEPGYYRGDLLLLSSPNRPLEVGDIVVFKVKGRDIPIVHRVHRLHITTNGTRKILTKGDNNYGDDVALYNPGQFFIDESDIMGRSIVYLPYVGQFTIIMSETKYLRESVIVVLLMVVFLFHEE